MQFSIDIDAPINGIYLSTETIDLLSIIQCKTIEQLRSFATNCAQLNISSQEINSWTNQDIGKIKEYLVTEYQKSFVPMEDLYSIDTTLKKTLEHCNIDENTSTSIISAFHEGTEKVNQALASSSYDYLDVAQNVHRFISSERDQITHVTLDELYEINSNLKNHNTVLVASGRYYNVKNRLYDEKISDLHEFDFYYPERNLDFCYQNQMYARYHTLLDKQTLEEHFNGLPKEEIKNELKKYVKSSIDFINNYNQTHKIDGKGVITSVDLFNEIISFDEPYKNMWKELHDITTDDLIEIFEYAKEHKPENVTYVYNEPFLEDPKRRAAVIEQLKEINSKSPGLIDTIGTQMHIEFASNLDELNYIEPCFKDLKQLQELGIGTQITEFDMCLPERYMFDENGKIRSEEDLVALINKRNKNNITVNSISEYKDILMKNITERIKGTNIQLDGITYWSISDILDHNLERTNQKTLKNHLNRDIATTRYSGLYSGNSRTITTQKLGNETLDEQNDPCLLDDINDTINKDLEKTLSQKEGETK